MKIPTEPIGSIPRPLWLITAITNPSDGADLTSLYDKAIRDTLREFEKTGAQFGTTDDCGFSPFCDDISTTRETAFAKIKARVEGTKLAGEKLFS